MNKIISQTFTYDLPDDYLLTTNNLKKTGTWTYNGPDKIWVFVNKETLKWQQGHFLTEDDDGPDYPAPLDCHLVKVDCTTNPKMCHIFGADASRYHYDKLSTADETLADGAVYTRPDPPPPDHTHDHETVTYDPATDTWSTPWREPHVTWNHIRGWRNGILSSTDHIATADDIPSATKTAWQTYRQKLRDLPQVHGATNMLKTIDLTAASPTNTQGQTIIQLTDATGITVGMDVGITTFGCPDIFASHTTVVSISSNQITLSSALVATPLSINGNAAITFSPAPTTHPWKVQPYDDPNGIYGTNKPTTTDPLFDPDPNHP